MCSDHVLGRGSVNHEGFFKGSPVTRVCYPLNHNCCGKRKVQYIFHEEDGPKVVSLLLLLSGDVETNPGPGKIISSGAGVRHMQKFLRSCLLLMDHTRFCFFQG
jgi:hypothetical protein